MDDRLQIVAILGASALLLLVLEMVRRRALMERYALLWLLSSVVDPRAGRLDRRADALLARQLGIAPPPNALFFVAVAFILLLLLHFSAAMSRLSDQSKVLAQRLAILEQQLRELEPNAAHAQNEAEHPMETLLRPAAAAGADPKEPSGGTARYPARPSTSPSPTRHLYVRNLRSHHWRTDPRPAARLEVMSDLIAHRGPDDAGVWAHERGHVGFGHRRLSIIDPSPAGHQPMATPAGRWITYNGEVYNYPELRDSSSAGRFRHRLRHRGGAARARALGRRVVRPPARHVRLRALGRAEQELLCARDRFGIKPFYYAQVGDVLYFASEAKALLAVPARRSGRDLEGLKDYLAFQFCLAGKTLFEGVRELLPGHRLRVRDGARRGGALLGGLRRPRLRPHGEATSRSGSRRCSRESVRLHLRSDVPVGRLPERRARLERGGVACEPCAGDRA